MKNNQIKFSTLVLVQNNDIKTKMYKKHARKYNIEIIGLEGNEILYPFKLWKAIISGKKPNIFVYRYLNDSPNILKTLLRFISEILVLFTLKIFNINLYWINHNVDRETLSYYPSITKIRRKLISHQADKIFVTNKLLVSVAMNYFPKYKSKINYLTFGYVPKDKKDMNQETIKILKFIERSKKNPNSLIGVCVGNANYKTKHFEYINEFIKGSERTNYNVFMIIGGNVSEYYRKSGVDIFKDLKKNSSVLIIDRTFDFQDEIVIPKVDFYWRVYEDYSTPYTVLQAAYYQKPIVTLKRGFLYNLVSHYNIGFVAQEDFSDLEDIYYNILNCSFKKSGFDAFLNDNSWDRFLKQLNLNYLREEE